MKTVAGPILPFVLGLAGMAALPKGKPPVKDAQQRGAPVHGLVLSAPGSMAARIGEIHQLVVPVTMCNVAPKETHVPVRPPRRSYLVLAYHVSGNQVSPPEGYHEGPILSKGSRGTRKLAPGEVRKDAVRLSESVKLTRPGVYRLVVLHRLRYGAILASNLIELTVTE